jgi:hypothetical protein
MKSLLAHLVGFSLAFLILVLPAYGQRTGVLPDDLPAADTSTHPLMIVRENFLLFSGSVPRSDVPPVAVLSGALLVDPGQPRWWTVRRYTIAGVLAGAAIGTAFMFVQNREACTTTESMCGLAVPVYAGAGAVAGGFLGYAIGKATN